MGDSSFTPEVRKVETEYGETGIGQANRVDVTYELGFEINGAWVKVGSVAGSTVDNLVAQAKDRQPPAQDGPTMADVTPTPVPQAQASEQQGTTSI
jgi:hypothetical protein